MFFDLEINFSKHGHIDSILNCLEINSNSLGRTVLDSFPTRPLFFFVFLVAYDVNLLAYFTRLLSTVLKYKYSF